MYREVISRSYVIHLFAEVYKKYVLWEEIGEQKSLLIEDLKKESGLDFEGSNGVAT